MKIWPGYSILIQNKNKMGAFSCLWSFGEPFSSFARDLFIFPSVCFSLVVVSPQPW